MLKTNSKKAKENVRNYIISASEIYVLENIENAEDQKRILSDFNELSDLIHSTFKSEYLHGYVNKNMTYQDAFIRWASGLAFGSLFDYYLSSAVDTLGNILDETEEEKNKYSQADAEKLLTYLIYRETKRA